MIAILKRILLLLETYFEEQRVEQRLMKEASTRDNWLDCHTAKMMLRKGDRTLFNYVQAGKLISKKVGGANFYLESSVMNILNGHNSL